MSTQHVQPYPRIHAENLIQALRIAIEVQRGKERSWGYTGPSAFLAGLESNLAALESGQYLEIIW